MSYTPLVNVYSAHALEERRLLLHEGANNQLAHIELKRFTFEGLLLPVGFQRVLAPVPVKDYENLLFADFYNAAGAFEKTYASKADPMVGWDFWQKKRAENLCPECKGKGIVELFASKQRCSQGCPPKL